MSVSSGAGAAMFSGANYQSRIAAYFIVSMICEFDTGFFEGAAPNGISFETANPVDDVNLILDDNRTSYIQAKRHLSFSMIAGQDLHSCFDQFVRQWISDEKAKIFFLITTSQSSRRITVGLSAILQAIRSGSEEEFRRDQNKALTCDLDLIIENIGSIYQIQTGSELQRDKALQLLRLIHVLTLDVEENSAIEQAAWLYIAAKNCVSPQLFWGNLIADCVTFSSGRRSLGIDYLRNRYTRFFSSEKNPEAKQEDYASNILSIVTSGKIPTGREVVIGTLKNAIPPLVSEKDTLHILEFYRFGSECNERVIFRDGKCCMQNGMEVDLLGRAATYAGLERLLEQKMEAITLSTKQVIHCPINLLTDPEESRCAMERRALLEASLPRDGDSIECVHCEKPIFSNDVDFLEYLTRANLPKLGLSHHHCTKADDRVIGTVYSKFFKDFGFLQNFDAVTWFREISRGQGAYRSLSLLEGLGPILTWSGRSIKASGGTHIVEFELNGGTSEFSYHRGQLDRFSRADADDYCSRMNEWVRSQRDSSDPLCFSEDSKQFGSRSTLLMTIGAREKLLPINSVSVKKFSRNIANRYDVRDNWFAPVCYIRTLQDEGFLGIGNSLFLITEPFHLDRFLANWRECGLNLTQYEVAIFASDEEFDEFAREIFAEGSEFLIDPLFVVDKEMKLINGTRLVALESLGTEETIAS